MANISWKARWCYPTAGNTNSCVVIKILLIKKSGEIVLKNFKLYNITMKMNLAQKIKKSGNIAASRIHNESFFFKF